MTAFVQAELAEHLFVDLALRVIHHAAIEQLGLSGSHHRFGKNILHALAAGLALTIRVKRFLLTQTKFSGHNMDLLFLSMEYS